MAIAIDGSASFVWRRRSRGQWRWLDGVTQPLVEESEQHRVGYGPVAAPYASWLVSIPEFYLSATELSTLQFQHGGGIFWVQQLGSFAQSRPSCLGSLA